MLLAEVFLKLCHTLVVKYKVRTFHDRLNYYKQSVHQCGCVNYVAYLDAQSAYHQ